MKKIISFILMIVVFLATECVAFADDKSEFFEGMKNLQKLANYSSTEILKGRIETDEIYFRFRLDGKLQFNNSKTSQRIAVQINGSFNVVKVNVNPNESINGDFKGDIIFLSENGLYFRLNEVNLNTENANLSEEDQDFFKLMLAQMDAVQKQWFFVTLSELEMAFKKHGESVDILNKSKFSSKYHLNSKYNIVDYVSNQIKLTNTDKYKFLQMNYIMRVKDIKQTKTVKAPDRFKSVNDLISFFQPIVSKYK